MKTKLNNLLLNLMSRTGMLLSAIPLEVDASAHAALPESQRALYVANGDKFKLDVTGIEDTSGLKSALQKERDAAKLLKSQHEQAIADALKPYQGIDPVKTREMMSKMENSDEAALIAAGKIDEVIAKRMEKHNQAQQKLLDDAAKRESGALKVAATFMERVLDNHVRAAAMKAGIHPSAVDDALLRARSMFSLDDDGNAVQFDDDGKSVVLGKDGKTPYSPEEWLESMKEAAPHWFPANASGGGAGGSKNASGHRQMKRAQFDALDPAARSQAVRDKVAVVD